ncbi:sigma-70 family RNA polymerase sigma factor [Butyrivibrio sp. NC3005]|uniref:sigma-70 family RNA polymerase sigma factor n=1 Tax=Butyrivibrio sp. NC3005 TaxID=1280685 RepID=UPI000401F317|nr:sigma-70 family RNA polymerase sigma factor [Butyrivibrio sp. NC3005]
MESKNGIESALANLIQLSSEKGFLVFDDIYDEADKWALSIRDVDYLSSSIATRGILVYDEAPVTNTAGSAEDDYDDYAQRDYEAVFNRVIELDPDLEDFINAVRAVVPPQAREMDQLKYQVHEGNLYARDRVIQMHLRFAVRIALQRAEAYDCEIADTLQEACIGLITAVDRYDPDSSGAFGSYASLWIMQNIERSQATQRPTVYYPVHKKEGYFTMYPILKEESYLDSDIWTNPEVRRVIQERLGCDTAQAEDIIRQSMPIESLDYIYEVLLKNIDENEIQDDAFENIAEIEAQQDIFRNINADVFYWKNDACEVIERRALREILERLMGELKNREQEVLKARYGFEDGVEKTLEEVGQMFGVTRERIRQIESKALRKLSNPARIRKLKDFL